MHKMMSLICSICLMPVFGLEVNRIWAPCLARVEAQDNNFVPAGAGRFLSVFCAGLTLF